MAAGSRYRSAMASLRQFLLAHRVLAGLTFAAALMLGVLLPAGFMPDVSAGGIGIRLCPGAGPVDAERAGAAMPMPIPMPSGHAHHAPDHRHDGSHDDHAAGTCAFGALAVAGLAATDPVQLVLALLFAVVAALFFRPAPPLRQLARLRPPLRAPPLPA